MSVLSASVLTSGYYTSDSATWTTAAVSPDPNKLVLAVINTSRAVAGTPVSPAIAGNSLSWSMVANVTFGTFSGQIWNNLVMFRAMGSSPAAGVISISAASQTDTIAWAVLQIDGVDTSGVNGSAAIVQSAVGSSSSTSALTINLAAFANAANGTFGAFGATDISPGATTFTPGSGFTELVDTGAEWASLTGEWRLDNSQIVNVNAGRMVSGLGGIAIEIKAAGTGSAGGTTLVDTPFLARGNSDFSRLRSLSHPTTLRGVNSSTTSSRTIFGLQITMSAGTLTPKLSSAAAGSSPQLQGLQIQCAAGTLSPLTPSVPGAGNAGTTNDGSLRSAGVATPPPYLTSDDEWKRQMTVWAQAAAQGKTNNTGQVTLLASGTETTVVDARAGAISFITFMPTTQAAVIEMTGGLMFVAVRQSGQFIITHSDAASASATVAGDRIFGYAITG